MENIINIVKSNSNIYKKIKIKIIPISASLHNVITQQCIIADLVKKYKNLIFIILSKQPLFNGLYGYTIYYKDEYQFISPVITQRAKKIMIREWLNRLNNVHYSNELEDCIICSNTAISSTACHKCGKSVCRICYCKINYCPFCRNKLHKYSGKK